MLNLIRAKFLALKVSAQKLVGLTACCAALMVSMYAVPAMAGTLPTIAAVGTQHQVEGAINQGAGKAERELNRLSGQAKGLAREADGKAKRDVGRVESTVESAAKKTGEAADDMADSGKNVLSELGDQIKSAASGVTNSVKGLAN